MKVTTTYDDTQWQLVPKEPTPEMLSEWLWAAGHHYDRRKVWACLLSAAPTPPAQPTRSQQMREKGFTPRNSGFACDECGEPLASVLQVQVHRCKAPAQPAEEPVPFSGADETPPVFGRRWSPHPDGFGLKRDDIEGVYIHIDDALSVLHQWQQEKERQGINFCNAVSNALAVAQPAERKPQEWMPIETAPIGKEMIVVRGFNVCNSYTGDKPYTTDPYCVWQPIFGAFARWPHAFLPTHWMPLPAAPENGIKGES